MKKHLLALAVLSAFPAAAFADAGNAQLYGTIDLGVVHVSGIGAGGSSTVSSTGLSSGVQSPSVIGLKGTEDLGGGLRALFDVETGFCAAGTNQDLKTNGSTPLSGGYCVGGGFMQSQSWAALQGAYGTLVGGRGETRMYHNEVDADPFGAGMTGAITNLSIINQYSLSRLNQGLVYFAPGFAGFTASAGYSFAPSAGGTVPSLTPANATNVSRTMSANLSYTAGPIRAGLSYAVVTNLRLPAMLDPANGVNDGNLSGWQVWGIDDLGVVRLSAEFVQSKASYNAGNARSMMLGARLPIGPGALLLSFNEADTGYGMRNINLLGTSMYGTAKQYALGYTYALSKRTDLYASYAQINNSAHTEFAVGSATDAFTGAMGQNSSGFAIGLRHDF